MQGIKRKIEQLLSRSGLNCRIVLPDGTQLESGSEPGRLVLTLHRWGAFGLAVDEFSFGRAYVTGDLDIDGEMGDLLDARGALPDRSRLSGVVTFLNDLFLTRWGARTQKAIDFHYSFGDDFYHLFIDREHHFYSHGVFHDPTETIEQASTHKLEQMYAALELEQGMHLLDIGGGWGPVTKYCCPRGVKVTTLTLADDSYAYIGRMIDENGFDGTVIRQDFMSHQPQRPYDAIVIYGVIEHLPHYRSFAAKVWDCLAPGAKMYLDGSADYRKYSTSNFVKRYIWPGTHSFMCVQDVVQELLYHGLDVLSLRDETRDYELTMLEWARRFEARSDEIRRRWGEAVYRAFRVYLWGGWKSLQTRDLQAYHLVARRRAEPGLRPGTLARIKDFAFSLK